MSTSPMNSDALLESCDTAIAAALAAGADEAEVYASSSVERTIGIENNDLQQARQVSESTWGVRVVKDGAIGFATSNQPGALAAAARSAVDLAKVSLPDPLNAISDEASPIPFERSVDERLLEIELPSLAKMAVELLAEAKGLDSRLTVDTGAVGVNHHTAAIASSKGARASFEAASGTGYLFGMCVDGAEVGSFSYDGDTVRSFDDFRSSLSTSFARFVSKAAGAMGAGKGESFKGPILLPPETVQEFLIGDLLAMISAEAVRTGKSPLAEKVGELIAATNLTLTEEGLGLPGFAIAPFDREGIRRARRPLIDAGELKSFLYNSYEARAAGGGVAAGNATGGASSIPGVGPSALSIAAGDQSLEELSNMERGLIVTRFSGSSDPLSGNFSGVVKGGFLVENGERRPIDETTVAGNLYDCLKSISGISKERTLMSGSLLLPHIRIDGLSVSAG